MNDVTRILSAIEPGEARPGPPVPLVGESRRALPAILVHQIDINKIGEISLTTHAITEFTLPNGDEPGRNHNRARMGTCGLASSTRLAISTRQPTPSPIRDRQ